ncbi:DUF389 domain-containing protein [Arenibacter sp. 6A1]|uniref:DUF389 domain-containing protein n=1 Tax=Arenibacter sp. 6A1 TaxID=2720391 RepID=UPI0014462ADA|nr:DUF389 domain-containing protein [Arenibacter sp. 6A1]NKI28145.1 DUF389 domain-containing protein [Arenibacter sp. 6A1]
MKENTEQDREKRLADENKQEIKKDLKGLLGGIKVFLVDLLDIRQNTDQEATKESIIADIPFKGHTSWILICSIFIASVGLNANSTAVVIGAMLISPLMGPILGIGLSLAINDIDTLRRSIKNFTVMVVLSVFTAFLFFYFFPLRDESSELLARTAPDIRDVLIAFFGGLALVIARAKKGTIASVIFGVAIATALMPPLCTVGFALAIGNFSYATGAMYLFTINTIFIGLATFLVIKVLRFPMVRYANSQRRRFIARMASIVAVAVMIPAGFTFYDVFQESIFRKDAKDFVKKNIVPYKLPGEGRYLENLTEIQYNHGVNGFIELVFMGSEPIPENVIATWNAQKDSYAKLKNTELKIVQGSKNLELDQMKYVNELYESQKTELLSREQQIQVLRGEVTKLNKMAEKQIPFQDISAEAKLNYDNMASIAFAYTISTDFNTLDTIPVFRVKWKAGLSERQMNEQSEKLSKWLQLRLKDPKIQVKKELN